MSSYNSMVQAMGSVGVYSLDGNSFVDRELKAYAQELDAFSGGIDEIIRESIVATAESDGLLFYEKIVGTLGNGLPIESRREMIESLLRLNSNDNTLGGITRFFRSLGLECEIEELPSIFDLYIKPIGGSYTLSERKYIVSRAKQFLPCHLTFLIDFRSTTWAGYDSSEKTFREIDALQMTWEDFEYTDI